MDNKLTIHLNHSEMIFENHDMEDDSYYHFAIDIPINLYDMLKKKISGRVSLLTEDDQDKIYFDHINAKSFYINDPSGNIVEFIA